MDRQSGTPGSSGSAAGLATRCRMKPAWRARWFKVGLIPQTEGLV
jgi:hypothetical protein